MEDFVWHLLAVTIGGAVVLLVARFSRKKWNAEHGEKSEEVKSRFGICLILSYMALTWIVYFDPRILVLFAIILAIISQIGLGRFNLLSEKPGLKKDMTYASAISTFLAAITGFFIHA